PYKVRRFNFFEYTQRIEEHPTLHMLQNPDVTVRSRGVMEKCTYCVQRIRTSQIEAQRSGAPMAANAVQTACQQVCPVDAIVFGDLNTPESTVTGLRHDPLNYALLGELNTQPRTTYLAAVRNPNRHLETVGDHEPAH
ncbi:MAG: TAT-variant-translocated molybdopterin oxidoreductase, partial [Planctomycetaceae bacterium]